MIPSSRTTARPLSLFAIAAFSTVLAMLVHARESVGSRRPVCTLMPGAALMLLYVHRDTTLRFTPLRSDAMSASILPGHASDSLLATSDTPMPAALVRLLQIDSATRRAFLAAGVTDEQPWAFIRAAPYRADCRTIRWTDSVPWVERGDTGYARATLAPPEQWIGRVPVLVIPDVWNYPYPRQRGLAYGVSPREALAPADAMYSLSVSLDAPDRPAGRLAMLRTRALAWARSNPAAAELEPARSIVRDAVLRVDWLDVERKPSRLRGTYRVTMESKSAHGSWYFRTDDRPGYTWGEAESVRSTANVLASPYVSGYQLVGYAAATRDAVLRTSPTEMRNVSLVWLSAADRPSSPGNDASRALAGSLEFMLSAAPDALWEDLEPFVPPASVEDSVMLARIDRKVAPGERQSRLPITLRIDERGNVHADTTLTAGGRTLHVSVVRIDAISLRRSF